MSETIQLSVERAPGGAGREFVLERPFHLAVVLWGERFRNYFLDYCLPTLMAPGNIPAIATRQRSKFLIATRPDDWAAMTSVPLFQRMSQYVDPVFVEIPPCPPGRAGCEHMGIGHKAACEQAFREKAYSIHVMPDCMFSDGAIARVQELARDGKELILVAALRFGEEPFLGHLADAGLVPGDRRRDSGEPLSISSREMALAAVNGFHPETLSYDWASPNFVLTHAAAWWRVPDEDGIVLHAFSWAPLLLDYAAVRDLDTSMMDGWTIDGDFLHRNIGHSNAVHVVEDSDEMFFGSWTPMAVQVEPPARMPLFRIVWLRNLIRAAQLRRTYHGPFIDPLKRRLFLRTVRWHGRPLNTAWDGVEREAARHLRRAIDDVAAAQRAPFSVRAMTALLGLFDPLIQVAVYPVYRAAVRRRLGQVIRGDRDAFRRVAWHLRRVAHQVLGRPFTEQAPKPPGEAR